MVKEAKQTHVSESKKKTVKLLGEMMAKKTVMVVSVKNLPSSQFQEIKKKIRNDAIVKVAKKRIVDLALEHSKNDNMKELVKYVQDGTAIIFSDKDAFELSAFLSETKSPAKAKIGQEAPDEIVIEAGPTELVPGPDITALSSVGLQVKVEGGKIAIMKRNVFIKKGEKISSDKASILGKLGITPFRVGLEPVAAFSNGKVYTSIKVNKEETLNELKARYAKGIAFAVSLNYVSKDTLSFILGKAESHEKAIAALIKPESNSN